MEKDHRRTENSSILGAEKGKRQKRLRKPQEMGTEDTRGIRNRRRAEEEDQATSGAIAVARRATSRGIALRKRCTATVGEIA